MKSRDIGLAVFVGVGVTLVELFMVGQLNHFNAPDLSLSTPIEAPAVIVHRPLPSPKELSRVETATETQARQAAAQTADLKMSALPTFKDAHSNLGLLSVLPGLGGGAMGNLDLSNVSSEPDQPARARRIQDPTYPQQALRNGIEGYVLVRMTIDSSGKVNEVLVVDSEPLGVFERSAREAARRFIFHPARQNGVSVVSTLEKKIVFKLK